MDLVNWEFLGVDRFDGDDLWIRWRITGQAENEAEGCADPNGALFAIEKMLPISTQDNIEHWVDYESDDWK